MAVRSLAGLAAGASLLVLAAEAKAQDVSPMIVKFNRVKWLVLTSGMVAMIWAFSFTAMPRVRCGMAAA